MRISLMNTSRPIIEAQKLVKAYGLKPVLRGLDLTVERGTFLALLGANGSGKSTFLRLVTGLTRPNGGHLSIGGWSIPQEAGAVRAQIGLVSHKPLVYDNLTARENLLFFGRLYNLPGDTLRDRVDAMLKRVGLFRHAETLPRAYSRGMLQRLSIARALLHDPDILLMDEPYTGLDQGASGVLDTLLAEAHSGGRTIVMVTHDIARSADLAQRVVIIARGVIGYDRSTDGLTGAQLIVDFREATGEHA
jgi:heme exporter protein A